MNKGQRLEEQRPAGHRPYLQGGYGIDVIRTELLYNRLTRTSQQRKHSSPFCPCSSFSSIPSLSLHPYPAEAAWFPHWSLRLGLPGHCLWWSNEAAMIPQEDYLAGSSSSGDQSNLEGQRQKKNILQERLLEVLTPALLRSWFLSASVGYCSLISESPNNTRTKHVEVTRLFQSPISSFICGMSKEIKLIKISWVKKKKNLNKTDTSGSEHILYSLQSDSELHSLS